MTAAGLAPPSAPVLVDDPDRPVAPFAATGAIGVALTARRWRVMPTWRMLALALGAPALGVLMTWLPELLALIAIWVAVALAIVTLDLMAATPVDRLRVSRRHELIFALGVPNTVTVEVTNRGDNALRLEIRDEFPESFDVDVLWLAGVAPAGSTLLLGYRLTPPRRGEYRFGRLNLRYPSRLGLLTRHVEYEPVESNIKAPTHAPVGLTQKADAGASDLVRVYPNLREVAKYELLARKGLTHEIGLRNARRLGEGTEFERLRDYVPDDEFRRIDWKASARRGKLIVREYDTEKSQHVLILLDTGRLMNAAVDRLLKLDWAVNAALMLSWIALGKGDHVGMLTFGSEIRAYAPPRRGRRQFQVMLDRLYGVQPEMAEPDFDAAFRYLAVRNPKRSLVVVFTDLVDPEVSKLLVRYLVHLVPHHVACCVVIDDPAMTTLAEQPVRSSVHVWERAIARSTLAERREVLTTLQRSGVITIDTPADKLNAALINRYLELKARGVI